MTVHHHRHHKHSRKHYWFTVAQTQVMGPREVIQYRGLNSYLHYFGSSLLYYGLIYPQNPILTSETPTLSVCV